MFRKRISVVTTTFYENIGQTRFHLACQTVGNAAACGYYVTIVDGSVRRDAVTSEETSHAEIQQAFRWAGGTVQRQAPGTKTGASRRQAFGAAPEADVHVWTEPEKTDLIRHVPAIIKPILDGEADIVVPKRTERSFDSYPKYQVDSEQLANTVFAEVTGLPLDVMFGPVAFSDKFTRYFVNCDPTDYGGADTYIQQIALMVALSKGARVRSVEIDFFYPSVQYAEEDGNEEMVKKRKSQFHALTEGFRKVAEKLELKKPNPAQG